MGFKKIQIKIDNILNKYILFLIPKWIKPNHLTFIRILLTPLLYYFLVTGQLPIGFTIFLLAVSTDFIDGSLARTRNQVTSLGNVIDPIADKLLISVVLLYIGLEYLVVKIILLFMAIEILGILINIFLPHKLGKPMPANTFGKIKMISQSIAIGLFLISVVIKSNSLTIISQYILFIALFFAAIAAVVQTYLQLKNSPIVKKI